MRKRLTERGRRRGRGREKEKIKRQSTKNKLSDGSDDRCHETKCCKTLMQSIII